MDDDKKLENLSKEKVQLQQEYGPRGFSVVGIPCNQFAGQEPGGAEEIQSFCSTTYGVDFPLLEKSEVNGPGRHPLYERLVEGRDGTVAIVIWLVGAAVLTLPAFRHLLG